MAEPPDGVVGDEGVREALRTWRAAECEDVRHRCVERLELANLGEPEARARVVATAKRIRGGSFKGTVMGDVSFEANGQLGSRHYLFTVQNGKIVVQP